MYTCMYDPTPLPSRIPTLCMYVIGIILLIVCMYEYVHVHIRTLG